MSSSVFLRLVLLGFVAFWPVTKFLIHADKIWFYEGLRGIYGRYIVGEDWRSLPILPPGMDYRWMNVDGPMLKIGHALGYSGAALANEISAVPLARRQGMRVLEVDLWQTDDGRLRCFHGPGDPGPLLPKTCTFDRLMNATDDSEEYIVLDIKTDFARAAKEISEELRDKPFQRRRVIFQIYRPGDVRDFLKLQNVEDYAGPIVTAYVARSSLDQVYQGTRLAGFRAFTFPLDRYKALSHGPSVDTHFFVHPVHDCAAQKQVEKLQYSGVYTLVDLSC